MTRESAQDVWDREDWISSEGFDDDAFPEDEADTLPVILGDFYGEPETVGLYSAEGMWSGCALPEALAGSSDWQEAYDQGVTYQDTVRYVIGAEAATLTDDDVDQLLTEITAGFSPIEAENFWKSLGRAAKSVGQVAAGLAPTVLPMLGGAVGTFFGGPAGTAIGSALGRAAGGAVGKLAARSPTSRSVARVAQAIGQVAMPALGGMSGRPASAVPAGGSSATAQLASLLQNPSLIQSLLGALLGGSGAVRIGESQVEAPFGAFMNALECLAAQAAEEIHDRHPQAAGIPAYLVASDGGAVESINVAEVRAARLLETLQGGPR